jgi:adenosylhomocysteine nucleosidase
MVTIGLLAAMTQESDALLRCIQAWKPIALGSFSAKAFELSGQTCVLVTSGMGARRAAEAARALVELHAPRMLISFGIAGAVEADLHIGDVIMAEAVCRLEQGALGPLMPLVPWPAAACEAAAGALSIRGARLLSGTAVTTPGSQVTQIQLGNMLHPVLEMETAAIAQVAVEQGIACFSIRAISDGPVDPIPFDLGEMMDADANLQAGRLLKAIVRHPAILFQSGRMLRNSRTAADNAAIALVAALAKYNGVGARGEAE